MARRKHLDEERRRALEAKEAAQAEEARRKHLDEGRRKALEAEQAAQAEDVHDRVFADNLSCFGSDHSESGGDAGCEMLGEDSPASEDFESDHSNSSDGGCVPDFAEACPAGEDYYESGDAGCEMFAEDSPAGEDWAWGGGMTEDPSLVDARRTKWSLEAESVANRCAQAEVPASCIPCDGEKRSKRGAPRARSTKGNSLWASVAAYPDGISKKMEMPSLTATLRYICSCRQRCLGRGRYTEIDIYTHRLPCQNMGTDAIYCAQSSYYIQTSKAVEG